jgi:hypothetical protein
MRFSRSARVWPRRPRQALWHGREWEQLEVSAFVCTSCLLVDERKFDYCPSCGAEARAKLSRNNVLLEIPAAAGMPCQRCMQPGHHLRFRRFRRVISLIFFASLQDIAGYFCPRCRLKTFLARQGTTLVTGWWGLFALFVYNPFAILLNFYGLLAAPLGARELGAADLDDVRAAAAEEEAFAELYASLPTWLTSLSESELELISAKTDYYTALGIAPDATEVEIKGAYRAQAKRHHPDAGPDGGSGRMAAINAAYEVLGDQRLRYAYDHFSEIDLGASPTDDPGVEHEDASENASGSWALSCHYCGVEVSDLEAGLTHLERSHPDLEVISPRSAFEMVEAGG